MYPDFLPVAVSFSSCATHWNIRTEGIVLWKKATGISDECFRRKKLAGNRVSAIYSS
jgi:hypothetical protein